jgi:hypothetical protein
MRETSIYKRPHYVLTSWGAARQPDGHVFVYGTDPKQHVAKRSEGILFGDFDQCVVIDEAGTVFYLSPDCTLEIGGGCEQELRALMATPRHIRKPESYVHADDSPELRTLLSKGTQT